MFYQICSIISSRKWMEINLENFSGGSREGPPPLFLDQTEAQREKKNSETAPSLISGFG